MKTTTTITLRQDGTLATDSEAAAALAAGHLWQIETIRVIADSEGSALFTALFSTVAAPFTVASPAVTRVEQSPLVLAIGVDVVSTDFDSGEGRVESYDPDLAEPWGVRWDRSGKLGWNDTNGLRVVGRGVS